MKLRAPVVAAALLLLLLLALLASNAHGSSLLRRLRVRENEVEVVDSRFGKIRAVGKETSVELSWERLPKPGGTIVNEKLPGKSKLKSLKIVGQGAPLRWTHSNLKPDSTHTYVLEQDRVLSEEITVHLAPKTASQNGGGEPAVGAVAFTPKYRCPSDIRTAVAGMIGGSALTVNTKINRGYQQLASCMQAIADKGFSGSSRNKPVWYVFAPWASFEVGKGEWATNDVHAALTSAGGSVPAFISGVCSSIPNAWGTAVSTAICTALHATPTDTLKVAGGVFVRLGAAMFRGANAGDMGALFSASTISHVAKNLWKHMGTLPGSNPIAKAMSMLTELRDALRDGNIAIYSDIALSGEKFSKWYYRYRNNHGGNEPRGADLVNDAATVWPSEALLFHRRTVTDAAVTATEVREVFDKVMSETAGPDGDFWKRSPYSKYDYSAGGDTARKSNVLVAAAFALYTEAGHPSTSQTRADFLVDWANVLLAYREQHVSVEWVFRDHPHLFGAMTPFIQLGPSNNYWSLYSHVSSLPPCSSWMGVWDTYAKVSAHFVLALSLSLSRARALPPSSNAILVARALVQISSYLWSNFDDAGSGCEDVKGRWKAILSSFAKLYRYPDRLWSFPNPDADAYMRSL
jgi:hypothetical protein